MDFMPIDHSILGQDFQIDVLLNAKVTMMSDRGDGETMRLVNNGYLIQLQRLSDLRNGITEFLRARIIAMD